MTLKNSYELTLKKQNPNLNEVRVGYKSLAYYFPIQYLKLVVFIMLYKVWATNKHQILINKGLKTSK